MPASPLSTRNPHDVFLDRHSTLRVRSGKRNLRGMRLDPTLTLAIVEGKARPADSKLR